MYKFGNFKRWTWKYKIENANAVHILQAIMYKILSFLIRFNRLSFLFTSIESQMRKDSTVFLKKFLFFNWK